MRTSTAFEFPPEQQRVLRQAKRLEWMTIAFLISVTILMYLVMGSSQAMKTAWIEDILSLIPPTVFLIASRIALWEPTERFPYGFHRSVSIAFLCASLALLATGCWLLGDAAYKLIRAEHPSIGAVQVFGHTLWLGWLMLPVLVWSIVPAVVLGRMKLPKAQAIHDKVLYADADMNKADWMTGIAALVGVLGIGFGYWWADSAAAALISLSVLHDGYRNTRQVIADLMDETPRTVDSSRSDDLPYRIAQVLEAFPWVKSVQVRMREEGHVYFGEALLEVSDVPDLPQKLREAQYRCEQLNWRVHDLVLAPIPANKQQMEQPS